MMNLSVPRLCIAAGSSGSGKTTLTCGLLKALINRGLTVASFKAGPDYIDPMFHREVIGAHSSNLDLFLLTEETVRRLLWENSRGKDLSVLEGVMGFYDGLGGASAEASTWRLAQVTGSPVVLVEDCRGLSLSAAARIKGMAEFREDSRIRAVILNHISSSRYAELKDIIEGETGLAVCGFLPVLRECAIESRHLGLVTAAEIGDLQGKIETLAARIEETVDLDRLIALARSAPPLEPEDPAGRIPGEIPDAPKTADRRGKALRIAVARDRAFCFYYEDGLKLLRERGAEPVFFSPLKDRSLPEGIRGLYIGGGYPELYGPELSGNRSLLDDIRSALREGLPCIAECGGFMYLHHTVSDAAGSAYPMVNFIPGSCVKQPRLVRFGYAFYQARRDNLLCRRGELLRGHEFHYWDSDCPGDGFLGMKPRSAAEWPCIVAGENLFAGFPHLHFCSDPRMAERFLDRCGRV
ncbi:MAG: cobyrinate a,c-diamide synthase [Spirochaetaceae bacterium]|jgi:cobyrinic acid a,c-diamide synthase|nr:cobyrinate a,c-diamide synthase [Spirochaetaceae bacterium]